MSDETKEVTTPEIKVDLSKVTDDMTANLATAEAVVNLNKEYLQLEKGKAERFLFTGLSEFVKEDTGEVVDCVVLMDASKNLFITGSHVIYNACKDLPSFSGIEIEFTGEKKLSGGKKLKEYRVILLNA